MGPLDHGTRGDARGFDATTNDDVFKIAWIGGSEIQIIDNEAGTRTFVAIDVRDQLPMVDGRPVSIDLYFISGMRIADEYAAVLSAIEHDVDAIVLSLNPYWVFNDLSIQRWDNLDPLGSRYIASRPSSWPLAASLYSPSDLLWGWSSDLDVMDDRYSWGVQLDARVSELGLLPDPVAAPPADPATLSELDQIRQMSSPMDFWSRYAPAIDTTLTGQERQAEVFDVSVNSRGSVNSRLVDLIGEVTTDSGIPTLVYLAQLNYDVVNDPLTGPQIALVEERLASHGAAYDSEAVRLVPEIMSRRAEGMVFNDIAHVSDPGTMPAVLAADLCGLFSDLDLDPDCEAS